MDYFLCPDVNSIIRVMGKKIKGIEKILKDTILTLLVSDPHL